MNKPVRVILLILGLGLLVAGAIVMKMDLLEGMKALPGVMIGVGAGLFGTAQAHSYRRGC